MTNTTTYCRCGNTERWPTGEACPRCKGTGVAPAETETKTTRAIAKIVAAFSELERVAQEEDRDVADGYPFKDEVGEVAMKATVWWARQREEDEVRAGIRYPKELGGGLITTSEPNACPECGSTGACDPRCSIARLR